MRKPNLFIVGEPKCGTTSLYEYLKQHPDIFMSKIKEPKFWSKNFHKEIEEHNKKRGTIFNKNHFIFFTLEDYENLFKDCSKKIAGEASMTYLYSTVAAKEIHSYNPEAKIIATFRNPVDFLHSLHSQWLFTRNETIEDFEEALKAEDDRKQGKRIPKDIYLPPSFLYYSKWAKFSEHLNRYYEIFDKEQIKIIILDDLKENPAKTYKEIIEFLNLADFTPEFTPANENKKLIPAFKPMVDFIRRYNIFKIVLPRNAYYKLSRAFYRLLVTKQPREPMDTELRKTLMKKYKPEVEKLSKLINRDLVTLWGYDKV